MKSKKINRKGSSMRKNGNTNLVCNQIILCFRKLNLTAPEEDQRGAELSFHSYINVTDVRSSLFAFYNVDTSLIRLYALHYELSEHEWHAIHDVLPLMQRGETVEMYVAPEIRSIGCAAILHAEGSKSGIQAFRKVFGEVVKLSRFISSFVCGLRDQGKCSVEIMKRLEAIENS